VFGLSKKFKAMTESSEKQAEDAASTAKPAVGTDAPSAAS
jgi:hypothetical protein